MCWNMSLLIDKINMYDRHYIVFGFLMFKLQKSCFFYFMLISLYTLPCQSYMQPDRYDRWYSNSLKRCLLGLQRHPSRLSIRSVQSAVVNCMYTLIKHLYVNNYQTEARSMLISAMIFLLPRLSKCNRWKPLHWRVWMLLHFFNTQRYSLFPSLFMSSILCLGYFLSFL